MRMSRRTTWMLFQQTPRTRLQVRFHVWTYASLLSSDSVSTGRGGGGAARDAVGSGLPSAFRFLSTWFRRISLFETPSKIPKSHQKAILSVQTYHTHNAPPPAWASACPPVRSVLDAEGNDLVNLPLNWAKTLFTNADPARVSSFDLTISRWRRLRRKRAHAPEKRTSR